MQSLIHAQLHRRFKTRSFTLHQFNKLKSAQNGQYFADDSLKSIFWNDIFSIQVTLKLYPRGLIVNKSALVYVMDHVLGNKPSAWINADWDQGRPHGVIKAE